MITRWCEIVCDTCGNANHYLGSIRDAERQYRKADGIITRNKRAYCDKHCYSQRKIK